MGNSQPQSNIAEEVLIKMYEGQNFSLNPVQIAGISRATRQAVLDADSEEQPPDQELVTRATAMFPGVENPVAPYRWFLARRANYCRHDLFGVSFFAFWILWAGMYIPDGVLSGLQQAILDMYSGAEEATMGQGSARARRACPAPAGAAHGLGVEIVRLDERHRPPRAPGDGAVVEANEVFCAGSMAAASGSVFRSFRCWVVGARRELLFAWNRRAARLYRLPGALAGGS
eukprot:tig00000492_g1401.t1